MRILGINAVFHDSAAALVVDGQIVFAAEEERFSRRKHGKRPVPYATWELPDLAIGHALDAAGLTPADLDLVGYSYDPRLVLPSSELDLGDPDDAIRTRYVERAPEAIATALPGLDPAAVRFVPPPRRARRLRRLGLARGRPRRRVQRPDRRRPR